MKLYLVTLAVGLLVGCIYGLLNVRSPAPPVIALVGLLGILLGEQVPPLVKRILGGDNPAVAVHSHLTSDHLFGRLPTHRDPARTVIDPTLSQEGRSNV